MKPVVIELVFVELVAVPAGAVAVVAIR